MLELDDVSRRLVEGAVPHASELQLASKLGQLPQAYFELAVFEDGGNGFAEEAGDVSDAVSLGGYAALEAVASGPPAMAIGGRFFSWASMERFYGR